MFGDAIESELPLIEGKAIGPAFEIHASGDEEIEGAAEIGGRVGKGHEGAVLLADAGDPIEFAALGSHAEENDSAAGSAEIKGELASRGAAAGIQNEIETGSRDAASFGNTIGRAGVNGVLGAEEFYGGEAIVADIGDENILGADEPGNGKRESAHRATADDGEAEERKRSGDSEEMNDIGERLGKNGAGRGERFGDGIDLRLGNADEFGKAAGGPVHAEQAPGVALILATGETRDAAAAGNEGIGDDSTAIGETADELVAENQRRLAARTVPEKARDIGAANAGEFDGNFQFTRGGKRAWAVLEFDATRRNVNESFHARQFTPGKATPA